MQFRRSAAGEKIRSDFVVVFANLQTCEIETKNYFLMLLPIENFFHYEAFF